MAQIFTTPDSKRAARAFLHDIALAGGLLNKSQRGAQNQNSRHLSSTTFISGAQEICKELINRDFNNVDGGITAVAGYRFNASLEDYKTEWKSFKSDAVAKSIVYMAELLDIYWDDTIKTPYEIDEFKKTMLGTAVYKYGRYISAIPNKSGRTARNKTVNSASAATSSAAKPPKNTYKQSGPQSGNVRDLRDINGNPGGTPGQKVLASGGLIYKIIGDNPLSKNTPTVFIKPLSASGKAGSTNKIFISSGNGYTDCTCYFDDPNEAYDFLAKITNSGSCPANVTNLRVVKNKADANGYFIVGTEFGPCAISAKTLNEALNEAVKERTDISGWEKATESYSEDELNELHTWMRRG